MARSKEGGVALRAMRTTHFVLAKSMSQTTFEELIVLQHTNGINMCNINLSKAFTEKAREAVRRQVLTSLAQHVQPQPGVALSADKATVNKRTLGTTAVTAVQRERKGEAALLRRRLYQSEAHRRCERHTMGAVVAAAQAAELPRLPRRRGASAPGRHRRCPRC